MSHKTGKRVLTASTSLALAVVGLAASPLAAHAAAGDVTFTNNCGTTDTATIKKNTGVYYFKDGQGNTLQTINSDTGSAPAGSVVQTAHASLVPNAGNLDLKWDDPLQTTWGGTTTVASGVTTFGDASTGTTELLKASGTYYQDISTVVLSFNSATNYAPVGGGAVATTAPGGTPATLGTLYIKDTTGAAVGAVNSATLQSDNKTVRFADAAGNFLLVDITGTIPTPTASAKGLSTTNGASDAAAPTAGSATVKLQGIHVGGAVAATPVAQFTRTYSAPSGSGTTLTDPNNTGYYTWTVPASWYNATSKDLNDVRLYQGSTDVTSALTGANLDSIACSVPSVPAVTSNASQNTITVTKGVGIDWQVTSPNGATTVTVTDGTYTDASDAVTNGTKTLAWAANSSATATHVLRVTGTGTVTITPVLASGYTGVMPAASTFALNDGLNQVSLPANPTVNDRDGKESDTISLPAVPGVSYFYAYTSGFTGTASWTTAGSGQPTSDAAVGEDGTSAPSTNIPHAYGQLSTANQTLWHPATATSNGMVSITRPSDMLSNMSMTIVAIADMKTKLSTTPLRFKSWDVATPFTDTTYVKALPAPTMVNGPGAADYYVLPAVAGVKWTVHSANLNSDIATYPSNDNRLGSQIPVYVNGTDTYTFTATLESNYGWGPGVTVKSWTQVYDSYNTVTPAAPSWIDQTGLVSDAVTFPMGQTGLTGYQFGISSGAAQPAKWFYIDSTWYGKTVLLTDLQKIVQTATGSTFDPTTFTHVWVKTDANGTTYQLAKDADGNAVASMWDYNFTNANNIIASAPTQAAVPGDPTSYTLTFPVDPKVTYSVTDANGVTKTIAAGDLGKALTYSGTVTVKAVSAQPGVYVIQPNADGTAPAPWVFTGGSVTPPSDKPANLEVGNTIDSGASVPTTTFHWSADGATSYDVTYHKTLLNGSAGPEIDWMMDTTDTHATFVAEPGDEYTVTVVAKNDKGEADAVSSTVKFDNNGQSIIGDVTSGQGTFSAGWNLLGKSQLGGLPYYGDTAALASNGATWTYTVPAGTKSFDLFATVHSLGAKGKIWVNGVNWANFETNPSYWGTVSNPYGYPVRRVQGWDNTKPATITVQQTEGGSLYLALDAYRVNK